MADIGIRLDTDTMCLWRGRDFRWSFENIDANGNPVDFPAGDLFFELHTGGQHNSVQEVRVLQANDGTYTLSFDGVESSAINYYDAVENPHDQSGDITDALEGISTIGAGNVSVSPAQIYPVWRLNVVLNGTSQNEVQQLNITNLLGWLGQSIGDGKMVLSYKNSKTAPISFEASAAEIQAALESLPRIGAGNVTVTAVSGQTGKFNIEFVGALAARDVDQILVTAYEVDSDDFFGQLGNLLTTVTTTTIQNGRQAALDERMMNLLNKYVNEFFNLFDSLLGVNIDFVVQDNLNFTIVVTSTKAFDEVDLVTFGIDVTSSTLMTFLNNILEITGIFDTIGVDFYWNHVFTVEFINELGLQPQPLIVGDASDLTNDSNDGSYVPEIQVSYVKPGKAEFTNWPFDIEGSVANLKIESEVVAEIAERTKWQLVFLPDGEPAGGDPVGHGRVSVME